MKKTYSKPDIMFDSFSMSVNIAACGVRTTFSEVDGCGYQYIPGMNIFMQGLQGCNTCPEDNTDIYDRICYHTFSDETRLFSS